MTNENIDVIRVRWLLPLTLIFIGLTGYYLLMTWDGQLGAAVKSLTIIIFEALFFGIVWGWLWGRTGRVTW